MPNIGPLEIIIVLVILLVIFGPKRIPELGRSVGHGMRNFKDSVTGRDRGEEPRRIEAEGGAGQATEASHAEPAVASATTDADHAATPEASSTAAASPSAGTGEHRA